MDQFENLRNAYSNSNECAKSELDIFAIPPTQTSLEEAVWDTIIPHSNFGANNTVRFDVPCTSTQYLDLSQTELHVVVSLLKNDKTGVTEEIAKKLSVANNLLHSIFKQIHVSLNGTNVENSNDSYAYRAYLENLLCNNKETKETSLRSEYWIKDSGNFDYLDTADQATKNPGFAARISNLCDKKQVHLAGRIHCDVFNINKYLLNNVNLALVMTRSESKFYLQGSHADIDKYKICIENIWLKVRRVKVSPSVMLAHSLALEKTTAKYPIKRVVLKPIVIPTAAKNLTIPSIHIGTMPSRVVIGFIHTDQLAGEYTLNPFCFRHLDISEMTLKVGSRAIPYSTPLRFDFDTNDYIDGYLGLFKNIRESSNDISYEEYKEGNTIFAFDLTPDLCSGEHVNIPQDGSLDMTVIFKNLVAQSITAMFYLEFDNIIEIGSNRQISYDYKV